MEWRGSSPWQQKVSGRSRAEGWMWAEGCAHPSTVTVLLRRGQLTDYGPTLIAAMENGATRVWGSQDPTSRNSQVPGLCECIPNKARAPCCAWRACLLLTVRREKRSCLFYHTCSDTVSATTRQQTVVPSLTWASFQILRFWEKPQERKLCYYKGSAFAKSRKGTHTAVNAVSKELWSLEARNFITFGAGISLGVWPVPTWKAGTNPSSERPAWRRCCHRALDVGASGVSLPLAGGSPTPCDRLPSSSPCVSF